MPQFLVIFPAFVAAFSFQKLFFCIVCKWYHRRLTTIAVVWFCSTLLSPRNWWQMSDFLNILTYLTPPFIFWNGEMKGSQKQLCYQRSRSLSPKNTKRHTFLSYNSVPNSKLHPSPPLTGNFKTYSFLLAERLFSSVISWIPLSFEVSLRAKACCWCWPWVWSDCRLGHSTSSCESIQSNEENRVREL